MLDSCKSTNTDAEGARLGREVPAEAAGSGLEDAQRAACEALVPRAQAVQQRAARGALALH